MIKSASQSRGRASLSSPRRVGNGSALTTILSNDLYEQLAFKKEVERKYGCTYEPPGLENISSSTYWRESVKEIKGKPKQKKPKGAQLSNKKFLYILTTDDPEFCYFPRSKIGISTNVIRRWDALQTASPIKLALFWSENETNLNCKASTAETACKKYFASQRCHKHSTEWFNLKGQVLKDYISAITSIGEF